MLHELLGHDSGKLFYARKYPTQVVCTVSGSAVGFYGKGNTYNRAFTSMSSSYEECQPSVMVSTCPLCQVSRKY